MSSIAQSLNPTQGFTANVAFIRSKMKALRFDESSPQYMRINGALNCMVALVETQQAMMENLNKRLAALEAYETAAQAQDLAMMAHEEDSFEEAE